MRRVSDYTRLTSTYATSTSFFIKINVGSVCSFDSMSKNCNFTELYDSYNIKNCNTQAQPLRILLIVFQAYLHWTINFVLHTYSNLICFYPRVFYDTYYECDMLLGINAVLYLRLFINQ